MGETAKKHAYHLFKCCVYLFACGARVLTEALNPFLSRLVVVCQFHQQKQLSFLILKPVSRSY